MRASTVQRQVQVLGLHIVRQSTADHAGEEAVDDGQGCAGILAAPPCPLQYSSPHVVHLHSHGAGQDANQSPKVSCLGQLA